MTQSERPKPLVIDVDAYLKAQRAGLDVNAPLAGQDPSAHARVVANAPVLATYAILSNNAYERPDRLPLPAGWSKVGSSDPEKGLAYTVFMRREGTQTREVVVAFRGTDDVRDWLHNLDPIHREQSGKAHTAFASVVAEYRSSGAKFVATGHSLGGGLALEMALKFSAMDVDAYAFDCAPMLKGGETPNMRTKRTSIWEKGEVLEPLRDLKSELLHEWRGTELVEVNFESGSPLKQHKIRPLALNLVKAAALFSAPFRDLRV